MHLDEQVKQLILDVDALKIENKYLKNKLFEAQHKLIAKTMWDKIKTSQNFDSYFRKEYFYCSKEMHCDYSSFEVKHCDLHDKLYSYRYDDIDWENVFSQGSQFL